MTPEPVTGADITKSRQPPGFRKMRCPICLRRSRRGRPSSPSCTSPARRRRSCSTAIPTTTCAALAEREGRVRRPGGVSGRAAVRTVVAGPALRPRTRPARRGRARRAAAEGDGHARQPQGRRSEHAVEGAERDDCAPRSVRAEQPDGAGSRPPEHGGDRGLGVVLFPSGDPGRLSAQASSQLVTMINWATSPHVKRLNMAFVLVDESAPISASASPVIPTSRRSKCRYRPNPSACDSSIPLWTPRRWPDSRTTTPHSWRRSLRASRSPTSTSSCSRHAKAEDGSTRRCFVS